MPGHMWSSTSQWAANAVADLEDLLGFLSEYKLRCLVSRSEFCQLPGAAVTSHGIEDGQQLVHAGAQSDLVELAGGDQPLIEAAYHRVRSHRRQGSHIQHRPHGSAATPDLAFTAPHAAIAVEGCNAHQRGDL